MRYIIGIDEVGRGCLAGPVTVVALAMPFKSKVISQRSNVKLLDSKKLSASQREQWFKHIKSAPEIIFVSRSVSSRVIDRMNISSAANLAAHRAIQKLITIYQLPITRIYLDGSLYIKDKTYQARFFKNARTVIKGDEKIKVVSLASIVAKVKRDAYMRKLNEEYPDYGFHIHKGYGTKYHREAIERHGPSRIHRRTFLTKY